MKREERNMNLYVDIIFCFLKYWLDGELNMELLVNFLIKYLWSFEGCFVYGNVWVLGFLNEVIW